MDQTAQQAVSNKSPQVALAGCNNNSNNSNNNNNRQPNSPYCLKCFDRVFGETCEECGKLITCDLGAINHEQRCWHASGACFKCRACSKSLLGSPFLPSSDGKIYCSIQCCELFKQQKLQLVSGGQQPAARTQPQAQPQQNQQQQQQQQQRLSLASYSDPRAPQGALQHQLSLVATDNTAKSLSASTQSRTEAVIGVGRFLSQQQQQAKAAEGREEESRQSNANAGLLRHKPLIDYLLANARSDEFSHQLLNCLYGQFKQANEQGDASSGKTTTTTTTLAGQQEKEEERKVLSQIGNTLEQIESERKSNLQTTANNGNNADTTNTLTNSTNNLPDQLSARRNKLNPFLIDSFNGLANKRASSTDSGNNNTRQLVMSMVMDGGNGSMLSRQKSAQDQANYINLDAALSSLRIGQQQAGLQSRQPADSVTNGSLPQPQQQQQQPLKPQQQQQLKKVYPKRAFPAGQSSANNHFATSKASQCSPAASLVSNEGTMSDQSATSSGVSTAPPVSSTNGSLKSHSPLSSTSSHSSVSGASVSSSNVEQGANKQPLRPQHVSSISATLERRRRVQPITELSVLDLLSVADDQMSRAQQQQPPPMDGFDQLVSHFEDQRNSVQRTSQPLQRAPIGSQNNFGYDSASKQECFFFELAQRLPRSAYSAARVGQEAPHQRDLGRLQPSPSVVPLDTNGLPTVESDCLPASNSALKSTAGTGTGTVRAITDHYSTVNKANKLSVPRGCTEAGLKRPEQQMVDDNSSRESFFAITSPLLTCNTDSLDTNNQKSVMRPTSSLSVLAPVGEFNEHQQQRSGSLLHPSFSTSSLNRPASSLANQESQDQSSLLLQPTTSVCCSQSNTQQQKKSVSFDPTVKDPATSSTGSMTLGRASALKSALKSSSSWQRQHQDFMMACSQSSQTMPSSLANQIKAGSLNAYSAYYDEQGRRIKLSSLLHQPMGLDELVEPTPDLVEQQQQPKSTSSGKSLLSGALSKLSFAGSQSSRGGRREERKLRQQQQQQQQLTVQTNQPLSNLNHQELFVQPIEPHQGNVHMMQVMQQAQLMPSTSAGTMQPVAGAAPEESTQSRRSRRRRSLSRASRSSRRRESQRRRGRHGRRSSGSGSRRSRRSNRSSRYCDYDDCYDSDASSRCSTCSSSSPFSDCSSSDTDQWDSSSDNEDASSFSSKTSYSSSTSTSDSEDSCSDSSSSCSSSSSPVRTRRSGRSRLQSSRRKSSGSSRRSSRSSSSRSSSSRNATRRRTRSGRSNKSSSRRSPNYH